MRKLYLDNIRWITIVLVVIYHVIYMFNGVQPFGVVGPFKDVQYIDAYMYLVYPWFMALLFVVAGMSSRFYLDSHTDKEFMRDRTRKLLVPSTIGLFIFGWVQGYYNTMIGGGGEDILGGPMPGFVKYIILSISGTGVLWFIQILWVFSVLLILIRKFEKDRLYNLGEKANIVFLLVFSVVIFGSAQILNTPIVTVYRFGIYGVCFFIGYFVFAHGSVVDKISRWNIPLAIAAIILGVTYTVLYFGENYAVEPYINNALACFFAWFAILAILSNMSKYGNKSNAFSMFMTRKSWGLYVFHYLPISIVGLWYKQVQPEIPAALVYIIALVMAFVGAYILNEIISRIPVIRWCVLGIRRKKNAS